MTATEYSLPLPTPEEARAVIEEAEAAGVELRVRDGRLVIVSATPVTGMLYARLRVYARGIIPLIEAASGVPDHAEPDPAPDHAPTGAAEMPEAWREGLDRVATMAPPVGFSPSRWGQVQADAAALASAWGPALSGLGWTTLDVFGACPRAPAARYDRAGLLLLLNGARLVAVTDDTATVQTGTGARLTVRRRPMDGAIPLWDLGAVSADPPE
ncbi:hypothetical protein [uncultured Rhodospira sp.]|uniref:hypothetical protein n=1 Tax=uncultured Rhodospira sp. TaxID=1936189 RepID=UPI00262DCA4E|nr:hypothetical protein [uncultured Rhodospira sp.]